MREINTFKRFPCEISLIIKTKEIAYCHKNGVNSLIESNLRSTWVVFVAKTNNSIGWNKGFALISYTVFVLLSCFPPEMSH